jgi:UDP-3-O-[3-hydroxymyristoyl] glucosamine N-acyltransferase
MPHSRFYDRKGPFSARALADAVEAELYQPELGGRMFADVAPLGQATEEHISFLDNSRYTQQFSESQAGACVARARLIPMAPKGMVLLISENPYATYAKIARLFYPELQPEAKIHPTAVIHPTAQIGAGCAIEPYAVIEADVVVGDGSFIGSGAVLRHGVMIGKECKIGAHCHIAYTMMGDRVIIHPSASIGQDGFGFATERGHHIKVPQLGKVVIGNDVEIGAGTTIDRGAAPDTVISDGVKIDNLVQIGHNVRLGKGCIIVSQVGISGSTQLGDYVVVGGQVGIAGHINIAGGSRIAAKSGVMRSVEHPMDIGGSPAMPMREWHKQTLALKNLTKSEFTKRNEFSSDTDETS